MSAATQYLYVAQPRRAPTVWYAIASGNRAGQSSFSLRRRLGLVAGWAVFIGAANCFCLGYPTLTERVLASTILACCALPSWLWLTRFDNSAPLMPFWAIVFGTWYGLPFFLLRHFRLHVLGPSIPPSFLEHALWMSLLGLAAVYAGYYGPHRHLLEAVVPKFEFEWPRLSMVKASGISFASIGLALYVVNMRLHLPDAISMIALYLGELSVIGVCILFMLDLSGLLDNVTRILLWTILMPGRILIGFVTGATAQGMLVGLTLASLLAISRRAMPWKLIAAGLVVLFIVRPVEIPYRILTRNHGRLERAPITKKVKTFLGLLVTEVTAGKASYQFALEISASRIALTPAFADVLRETPDLVPYWNGGSLYPLLFKPVPRFLYSQKPREVSGQTFAHRYGLLSLNDRETSYNLPQLVEMFANFGIAGIVLGMFFLGTFYRIAVSMFFHPRMGFGALIAGAYIVGHSLNIASGTSGAFGGLIWDMVFIAAINLVVTSL